MSKDDQVITKQYLDKTFSKVDSSIDDLNTNLSKRIDSLDSRIDEVNTSLGKRIDEVNTSLSQRIDEVNTSLGKRIDEVNTSLGKRIDEVNTSLSQRIDEVNTSLGKRIDEVNTSLSQEITDVMITLKTYIDYSERRFDNIDSKLREHDVRFDILDQKYSHLLDTMDDFIKRIDHYEAEIAARDHKIDRLERWIKQLAKQTGVKLSIE